LRNLEAGLISYDDRKIIRCRKMKKSGNSIPVGFLLVIFLSSVCLNLQAQDKIMLDSLQKVVSKKKGDTTEVRALNKLCLLLHRSDLDSALKCANRAMELAKKINYERGLSGCYLTLGTCYKDQGKLKEALSYFQSGKEIAEKNNIYLNIIYAVVETGLTHFDLGDYLQAEEAFLEALKLAKEKNDIPWQYSILNNMGMVNFTQKNYDKAAGYYKQVIDYMRTTGDKKSLSSALNNMGNVHFILQEYEEALKYYREAISLDEEVNDKPGLVTRYNNIGAILINQKKYKEALLIFEKSLVISRGNGNQNGEAIVLQNMATCNRELRFSDRTMRGSAGIGEKNRCKGGGKRRLAKSFPDLPSEREF
jgi:tetratricopeptide (TPR) repeat protein